MGCSPGITERKSLIDLNDLETTVTEELDIIGHDIRNSESRSVGTFYGLDISHFQGDVMSEMSNKDSLTFIICKATEGITYIDNDFRSNWHEIKEKGFIRGAYHFYLFQDDPRQQAKHFAYNIADIESSDIAPIVDVEQGSMDPKVGGSAMRAQLKVFLKELESDLNRKPIIYTDYGFAQEYLNDPFFADYDLWLAEYTGDRKPNLPNTWKTKGLKIWQKSDTYHAYSKTIDLDQYHGALADLTR